MSLKKFLAKHAGELSSVASVLGAVVHSLPIDRQDKKNLGKAIEGLDKAAGSIAKSAKGMPAGDNPPDAKATKSAVEALLPKLLGEALDVVLPEKLATAIGEAVGEALMDALEKKLPDLLGDIAEKVFELSKKELGNYTGK